MEPKTLLFHGLHNVGFGVWAGGFSAHPHPKFFFAPALGRGTGGRESTDFDFVKVAPCSLLQDKEKYNQIEYYLYELSLVGK
jgi:hypothetical protein